MHPGQTCFPLRKQHLEALRDVLTIEGERKLARVLQCDAAALKTIAMGIVLPTTILRQSIIGYLVRSGLSKHRGDPYVPDKTEQWPMGVQRARRVHGVFELESNDGEGRSVERDDRARSDRRFLQGLSALGKSEF